MTLMAKKKPTDRHKEAKTALRLSEAVGDALRQIAKAEDRTITAIVRRALRDYAEKNGHPWPSDDEEPA